MTERDDIMLMLNSYFTALIPYFEIMSIDLDQIYTYIDLIGVIVLAVLNSCLIERLDSCTLYSKLSAVQ